MLPGNRKRRQANFSQIHTRKNISKVKVVYNWAGRSGKAVSTSLQKTRPGDPRFPPWKEVRLGDSLSCPPQ